MAFPGYKNVDLKNASKTCPIVCPSTNSQLTWKSWNMNPNTDALPKDRTREWSRQVQTHVRLKNIKDAQRCIRLHLQRLMALWRHGHNQQRMVMTQLNCKIAATTAPSVAWSWKELVTWDIDKDKIRQVFWGRMFKLSELPWRNLAVQFDYCSI